MSKLKRVIVWKGAADEEVGVRLKDHGDAIQVVVVNRAGESRLNSKLLRLGPNGLTRIRTVNPDLGFPLDEHGRIKLDED